MEIRSIGVVGTGLMGTGIARCAALQGYDVTIMKWTDGSPDAARRRFDDAVIKDRERGKLTMEERFALQTRVAWTADRGALAACDLVIESIVEDEDEKRACFRALDELMKPGAILASNASALDILSLAKETSRPGRVLGLHFFNPVAAMPLVELAVTDLTDLDAVEAAFALATKLGKEPVVVAAAPGFVVNRLLMASCLEAIRMAFEAQPRVADVVSIDRCMQLGLNHKMGPFALMDLIGLDVILAMAETLNEGLRSAHYAPPNVLGDMVAHGWLGKKSGMGFYDYADTPAKPNPDIEKLL